MGSQPTAGSPRENFEYCEACLNLTSTLEGLSAACSKDGYPRWLSKRELSNSAHSCSLCKLVWRAVKRERFSPNHAIHIHAVQEEVETLASTGILDERHPLRNSKLQGFEIRGFKLKGSRLTDYIPPNTRIIAFLHAGAERGQLLSEFMSTTEHLTNPDDPAAAIVAHEITPTDLSGTVATEQVHKWLSICRQSHTKCAGAENVPLPTRVLDVGQDANESRVYLMSTEGATGNYIALSYIWGTSDQPVTTRGNFLDRQNGLQLVDLPKTIRDAVETTRKLGIRYLWVDCICIIQDSEEDRSHQIKSMGLIYKNAILTIAASASTSVKDGFLHRRSMPNSVNIPLWISENIVGSVNLSSGASDNISEEPLHFRGWAFQELILSRRVLIYGAHQLIWRCLTSDALEVRRASPAYVSVQQDFPVSVIGHLSRSPLSSEEQRKATWSGYVREYSRRSLSKNIDRINALVGVATELSLAWEDVYLIGLWSRTLIHDLGWWRLQTDDEPGQRILEIVPSWSWLSLFRPTEIPNHISVEDAEVTSNHAQSIFTPNDLRKIATNISLKARLLDVRAYRAASKHSSQWIVMDLDGQQVIPEDGHIAFLGHARNADGQGWYQMCLVLQPVTENRFERIGAIRLSDINWERVPYQYLSLV